MEIERKEGIVPKTKDVIPAKAGIYFDNNENRINCTIIREQKKWIPAFAGMTWVCGTRRCHIINKELMGNG